jgi:hypothetical protein
MSFGDCGDFAEGFAPVEIGKKWGFINQAGEIKIQPLFDECRWSFSGGLAAVRVGNNWGYINTQGEFVIPPRLEYAHSFTEDRAVILVDGEKHAVIDKSGVPLTDLFDGSGWSFSEGLLEVERDGKWGFIDAQGQTAIAFQFHRALGFKDGLAAVELKDEKNNWGFIDHTGKLVIPAQYQEAGYFGEGLAPVEVDFKYGYVDRSGALAIKPIFDYAYTFSDGRALIIQNEKYGFIDPSAKFVVDAKYEMNLPFQNGLAAVSHGSWHHVENSSDFAWPSYDGKWSYIDTTGKIVWE